MEEKRIALAGKTYGLLICSLKRALILDLKLRKREGSGYIRFMLDEK
jgi:hypothetical protein